MVTYTVGQLRDIALRAVDRWGRDAKDKEMDPIRYIKAIMLCVEEDMKVKDIVPLDNEVLSFVSGLMELKRSVLEEMNEIMQRKLEIAGDFLSPGDKVTIRRILDNERAAPAKA